MVSVTVNFQAGDKVQTPPVPAGPVMTVLTVGVRGQVECEWYVGATRNTAWFDTSAVVFVPPASK